MNENSDSSKPRKKQIPLPPHKYQPPCVKSASQLERITPGKIPNYYSKNINRNIFNFYSTQGL